MFACRRVRSSRNAVHTSYLSRQPEITPDMRGILFEWPVCSPAKPWPSPYPRVERIPPIASVAHSMSKLHELSPHTAAESTRYTTGFSPN